MLSRRAFAIAAVARLYAQKRHTTMFGNAEAYERFMGRWSRLVAPRLLDFAAPGTPAHLLDAGSGTGALASEIARRYPLARVAGVDLSDEYVAYASANNQWSDRVSFHRGDAMALTFAGRTFSAALSLLVFNFIPEPAKALRELRRVTQQGGTIAAAVWDYGGGMRMLRAFWDAAVAIDPGAEKLDEKHMPLCRAGELSALWRTAGLGDVREQPLDVNLRFANFSDYWEPFLLGQGPAGAYVARLAPQPLSTLRDAVRRQLAIRSDSEPITLPARVWAVRGLA